MALISFRLFRKNLGNLKDFFGQMVYRPPWQKISRTPMGKRKGIRARDHAPKSSLPFPLLTPATQAISQTRVCSQTTLLASLRCRVTTPKLYLGVLDGTGSRGCLDFELANSLEETLSCFDTIWAGFFVNGRVRTPADHPSGRTCCSNSAIPEKAG